MYCSRCGNKLEENIKYCPKCGTKILERQVISKKFKPRPVMIIVIAINIILLLLNIWFSISTIGTEKHIVSSWNTNKSLTIRINEKRLDRAIENLAQKDLEVLDEILVIHENYQAKQYLLVTRYNSEHQNLISNATGYKGSGFYYIYALDTKMWQLNQIESASILEGKNYVINEALDSNKIVSGQVGKFTYNKDSEEKKTDKSTTNQSSGPSSQGYVFIALIIMAIGGITYWRYNKTKRISTIVSIVGIVCIIVQLFLILPYIPFEQFGYNYYTDNETSSVNVNVHGTYNNKKATVEAEGYGTSYSVYSFLIPGNVKYEEEGITYKGSYTIDGNQISITYYEALDMDTPITLDKLKEKLTIKDNNTLVTSNGIEFLKE